MTEAENFTRTSDAEPADPRVLSEQTVPEKMHGAEEPADSYVVAESKNTGVKAGIDAEPEDNLPSEDVARMEHIQSAEGSLKNSLSEESFEGSPEDSLSMDNAPSAKILGIRLRKAGQVFFFHDAGHTVRIGSKVIVELEQGPALGEVVSILDENAASSLQGENLQGTVTGLATAQDIALHTENSILAAEATAFCKTCIRQRELDMKLVDVEVLHDRSKIIFFFTAPSRIDFRELVKDLVRNYRTRIELRQIGVRHETQMIGGLGNCGMVCCCHKYLRKFAPVTIKMAKEQNLFLNPAKLSGMCGRLLCCLSFEQSNYEEFNRRCPKLGKKYTTAKGTIKIIRANMFSQSICGLSDANEELEFTLDEWEALTPQRAEPMAPEQQRAAQTQRSPHPREGDAPRKGREQGSHHKSHAHDPAAGKSQSASLESLESDSPFSTPQGNPGEERQNRHRAGQPRPRKQKRPGQSGDDTPDLS